MREYASIDYLRGYLEGAIKGDMVHERPLLWFNRLPSEVLHRFCRPQQIQPLAKRNLVDICRSATSIRSYKSVGDAIGLSPYA